MTLARLLAPGEIDGGFDLHAEGQHQRKIPFSALTELMSELVLNLSPSVNPGYKKLRDQLTAARSCAFGKLERVEPRVTQASVRPSYEQTRQICNQMRMWNTSDVPDYRTKILDGNRQRNDSRITSAFSATRFTASLDSQNRGTEVVFGSSLKS